MSVAVSSSNANVYHFQKGDLFYLNADQEVVDNTNAKVQRFFLQKVTKSTTFREDFIKASQEGRLVFYKKIKEVDRLAIHMKWFSTYTVNRAASGLANKTIEGWQESSAEIKVFTENGYLPAPCLPGLLTVEQYQKLDEGRSEIANLLPSKTPPPKDCCVIL